jgi:hypothetical protein
MDPRARLAGVPLFLGVRVLFAVFLGVRAAVFLANLLAVLFGVRLRRLLGVAAGMSGVAGGGVGVMRGGFVLPGLVMFRGFRMMAGRMGMVLRGFLVVFCGFLRHGGSSKA